MELNPVLERFAQRSPLPVMARAVTVQNPIRVKPE
jgi:hypothetical protein